MSGAFISMHPRTADPEPAGTRPPSLSQADRMRFLAEETIFRGSPTEALERISELAVEASVARSSTLFCMGEPSSALHFVVRGGGLLVKTAPRGRQQVLHRALAGDMVGCAPFFDGRGYPASFVAETDCLILSIPRQALLDLLAHHPTLGLSIMGCLAERLRLMASLVETISFQDTAQRLWGFLLEISTPAAGGGFPRAVDPLPTREHLARSIGTVREVVSRQLSRLAESGHLRIEGKQLVLLRPLEPPGPRESPHQ